MSDDYQIISNDFDALIQQMIDNSQAITDETAQEVVDDAKNIVAVRSGATRASVYMSSKRKSTYADAVSEAEGANPKGNIQPEVTAESDDEAVVSVAEEDSLYLEYGTSHMAAQPFLTPALESHRQKYESKLAEGLFDE